MYPYIGLCAVVCINLYFAWYYILGAGHGELSWMGYVSLVVAVVFMLLLNRYRRSMKRQRMKQFNSHIKSEDDRLIR